MPNLDDFFAFARERHSIYLRRARGDERPWTTDPVLASCRFTNVFRELDKTTVWFKDHVRNPLKDKPEVLLATVLFRWFNRIMTGESLFCQEEAFDAGLTAFERFLKDSSIPLLKDAILLGCGDGPYVTGAFIINTPTGMTKLDGVLWAFGEFAKRSAWFGMANNLLDLRGTGAEVSLEALWTWLRQFPRLGDFMAYEIVTDLRHTSLLDKAPDIMTWANPGPGAKRGLSYIHGGARKVVPDNCRTKSQQIERMREILDASRDSGNWAHMGSTDDWPPWEMRDVEHTLCEFAKYTMVKTGEGRTKGMFR